VVKTFGSVERGFNDLRCAKAAKCESQVSNFLILLSQIP